MSKVPLQRPVYHRCFVRKKYRAGRGQFSAQPFAGFRGSPLPSKKTVEVRDGKPCFLMDTFMGTKRCWFPTRQRGRTNSKFLKRRHAPLQRPTLRRPFYPEVRFPIHPSSTNKHSVMTRVKMTQVTAPSVHNKMRKKLTALGTHCRPLQRTQCMMNEWKRS